MDGWMGFYTLFNPDDYINTCLFGQIKCMLLKAGQTNLVNAEVQHRLVKDCNDQEDSEAMTLWT